jgi:ABC-type nitrate/sulfonate/bicarbonate transport system permease component
VQRAASSTSTSVVRHIATRLRAVSLVDSFASVALIGALIVAWAVAAELQVVTPFLLPAPMTVLRWITNDLWSGKFFINTWWTFYRALMGFMLAAVFGVGIGILMFRLRWVRWFFDPIVSIGLPIPKIALLPVFMLWFGLYDASKILMVAFSAVFQVIASTWQATRAVEKELIWSARAAGASEREILWEVVTRAASPQILTGLQITFPVCLIVVLITEMQMGGQGLGESMLSAARYAKTAGVFAGIIEIGLVGVCAIKAMEWLRRWLLAWHQETIRESGGSI